MTSAVFDCMVFLQAVASPSGAAAACLGLVDGGQVQLFLSPDILDELVRVLHRPAVRQRFPLLTDEKVDAFLSKLTAVSTVLRDVPSAVDLPRDPKDQPYLNLAVAAHVGFLVTRDKDLLDLVGDTAFSSRYPDLKILDPGAFLAAARAEAGSP